MLKTSHDEISQRYITINSERNRVRDINIELQKEVTRLTDTQVKDIEYYEFLSSQNERLKLDENTKEENIRNLEVKNISLILQEEEMENEKFQLSKITNDLHVEILNLKIQNKSLIHKNETGIERIKELEESLTGDVEEELREAFKDKEFDYQIILSQKKFQICST